MKKNFWMGSLNTALLIGFILLGITVLMYFMGHDKSVSVFFGILTVLCVISTINFARDDGEKITFFTFLVIPHSFRYNEIFTMNHLSSPAKPQFGIFVFHLKSGERKQIKLGLYPLKTQEAIREFLAGKITLNEEYYNDRERLTYWLNKARRRNWMRKSIISSILILIGIIFQIHTWSWDWKFKYWLRTEAIIEENRFEETKVSEQETIKIYHLRYSYVFDGKDYTGFQIAGGAKELPSRLAPGSKLYCLVNPDKHSESAIIAGRYRGDWISNALGFFFLFLGCIGNICAVLPFWRKVEIPESLKDYIVQFEPGKVLELTQQVRGECQISVGKLKGAYREIDGRYGCFPLYHEWGTDLVMLILLILSILGGRFIMPHFFIVAALILFLFYQSYFPRGVIFDRVEKKMYWSRYFSLKSIPDKIKRNDVLSESDLIALGLTIKQDNHLFLTAIRKDGVYIPIVKADLKRMEQLYSDTVIIAGKLGNLPIIII